MARGGRRKLYQGEGKAWRLPAVHREVISGIRDLRRRYLNQATVGSASQKRVVGGDVFNS